MINARWTERGVVLTVGAIAGMVLGWILWKPKPVPPETYAPEVRQQDGSLVLERKPHADAQPAHQIPRGARVERVVQVKVQPRIATPTAAPAIPGSGPVSVTPDLQPPVTVDLSLVRLSDQTRRVIASSPDGEVISGVDIPVETARPVRSLRWAAGGLWNPSDRTWGAWLQRDLGPAVLGVDAFQVRDPAMAGGATRWLAHLRLGVRF